VPETPDWLLQVLRQWLTVLVLPLLQTSLYVLLLLLLLLLLLWLGSTPLQS
jgi:hypothetical protein